MLCRQQQKIESAFWKSLLECPLGHFFSLRQRVECSEFLTVG